MNGSVTVRGEGKDEGDVDTGSQRKAGSRPTLNFPKLGHTVGF